VSCGGRPERRVRARSVPTAADFADWTAVDRSPAVATGTLNGSLISVFNIAGAHHRVTTKPSTITIAIRERRRRTRGQSVA